MASFPSNEVPTPRHLAVIAERRPERFARPPAGFDPAAPSKHPTGAAVRLPLA